MDHSTHDSGAETASLPEQIRSHIINDIESWSDQEVTTEDLLRIYREQIGLLLVTEQVRSALTTDPFEHLRENVPVNVLEQLRNSATVTSHHAVHTMEGYVRIEATVRLSPAALRSSRRSRTTTQDRRGDFELNFQYTRPTVPPIRVSYTISMSFADDVSKPPQRLLWVHVDAPSSVPSNRPAVRSSENDGWSDMEEEEEEIESDVSSCRENGCADVSLVMPDSAGDDEKTTMESVPPLRKPLINLDDVDDEKGDQYEAGMNPEAVSQLIYALQLGSSMPDITVFFLLMTFPFYEHEWDIVGYLLEAVFDSDEENEVEEDSVIVAWLVIPISLHWTTPQQQIARQ